MIDEVIFCFGLLWLSISQMFVMIAANGTREDCSNGVCIMVAKILTITTALSLTLFSMYGLSVYS